MTFDGAEFAKLRERLGIFMVIIQCALCVKEEQQLRTHSSNRY